VKACVSVTNKKKFKRITDSKHNLPIAKNLLDRKFDVEKPNTVWCSDIAYLGTNEDWQYLAVVIDLYPRKVGGWALSNRVKVFLVKDALSMVFFRRRPSKGRIHDSDRGSQYAAGEYQKMLNQYAVWAQKIIVGTMPLLKISSIL
jgi:putative transposase